MGSGETGVKQVVRAEWPADLEVFVPLVAMRGKQTRYQKKIEKERAAGTGMANERNSILKIAVMTKL